LTTQRQNMQLLNPFSKASGRVAFSLRDHWVWDFWLADDGATYHMFYLHAPKSLGDPGLRHRHARIGHATSSDLRAWVDHGRAFEAGPDGSFDGTATWTGSVVRGPDGRWRMYYTGSRFLSADSNANVETVGMAVSDDLFVWNKLPGPIVEADPRWYETLGTSTWPEEAWRDPWVFADEHGTWHMLITARSRDGEVNARGVVGHATSPDLLRWQVQPPLSETDCGFAHIEVPQLIEVEGERHLLFCCDSAKLSGRLAGQEGGIWSVAVPHLLGPYAIQRATRLTGDELYAGRIVVDRLGHAVLLGFENARGDGEFGGRISDPLPVTVRHHADGLPYLAVREG